VFHSKISSNDILKSLPSYPKTPISYIKHEPCIMHVACKTLSHASNLVSLARNAGWKKSGILNIKQERVMCELVSTEILAAPIADKGKLIVPEDYLKILVSECNKKLDMTRNKIKNLEKSFK
jgi:tRNA(Phe) wybutosine-synthesizing methylase Tyw3